jgi:hypothetical protein
MVEFLETTGVTAALRKLILDTKLYLYLISPYVQLSDRSKELLKEVDSVPGIKITFFCRKDGKISMDDLNFLQMKLQNVQVYEIKNLHAKCYLNENTAIITSMNLYQFSQENNREMGIKVEKSDGVVYDAIYKEIMSLDKSKEKIQFRAVSEKEEVQIKKSIQKENIQQKKQVSRDLGFCIRCGAEIALNPDNPLCSKCYPIWAKYSDPKYPENCCHVCGKESKQSVEKPVCYTCYKKLHK